MGTCKAILKGGKRPGEKCGAKTKDDEKYCAKHKNYVPPDDVEEDEDGTDEEEEDGEEESDSDVDSVDEATRDYEKLLKEDDDDDEEEDETEGTEGTEETEEEEVEALPPLSPEEMAAVAKLISPQSSVAPIQPKLVVSISSNESSASSKVASEASSTPSLTASLEPLPEPSGPRVKTIEEMLRNLNVEKEEVVSKEEEKIQAVLKLGNYTLEDLLQQRSDELPDEYNIRRELTKKVSEIPMAPKEALIIGSLITKKALKGVVFSDQVEALIAEVFNRI